MSGITAQLVVSFATMATSTASLDLTRFREWTETLNDVGSGSITFQNDDPALAFVESTSTAINFFVDGTLAFTMIPEIPEATVIARSGNDGDKVTKWTGRGHAALLDRAIQYPALQLGSRPVEEERAYNWTSPVYEWVSNGAVAASVICSVTSAQHGGLPVDWDADFADPGADVLGPSSGTTTTAPTGNCYYQQSVTIVTDGTYEIQNLMDNYGEVYFDGALLCSPGQVDNPTSEAGFLNMTRSSLDLSAGLHSICARVYNAALPPSNTNDPTGWAFCVAEANADGTLGSIAGSSSVADGALVIEYPAEPPGMTPGRAILNFIDECQNGTSLGGGRASGDALAAINVVSCSFGATNDTGGTPWPSSPEIATKIGTSLLTFLKEMSATYIDWYMAPGTTVLDAWVAGGRGSVSGVDFHAPTTDDPASGNLLEHVETGEG